MENEATFFEDKKIEFNDKNLGFLKETAKWTRFMAVIGFIGIGLMVLGGVFGASAISKMNAVSGRSTVPPLFFTVIYVVLAAVYYLPIRYLWQFSVKMETGIKMTSQMDVDSAFGYLKSHYKYIGIMMIVLLSLYVLIIIIAIIALVATQMR